MLKGGGGGKSGFFIACPAGFPFICDSFFFLLKIRGGGPLDPPLIIDFFPHHHYPVMYSIDITGAFASWQGFIQGRVCSNG